MPNSSEAIRERSGVVASLLAEKGETLLRFFHGSLGSLDCRLTAMVTEDTLAIGLRAKYNYSSLLIFSTLFTFQLYSVFSCVELKLFCF